MELDSKVFGDTRFVQVGKQIVAVDTSTGYDDFLTEMLIAILTETWLRRELAAGKNPLAQLILRSEDGDTEAKETLHNLGEDILALSGSNLWSDELLFALRDPESALNTVDAIHLFARTKPKTLEVLNQDFVADDVLLRFRQTAEPADTLKPFHDNRFLESEAYLFVRSSELPDADAPILVGEENKAVDVHTLFEGETDAEKLFFQNVILLPSGEVLRGKSDFSKALEIQIDMKSLFDN